MRKLILSILLLLVVSGCGQNGNDLDNRIIPDSDTGQVITSNEPIEGILKAQEIKLNMYGTHMLEDEMGAFLVYLQSKKINLSAYLDAKVSIEGEIVKTHDGKTILEVNKVDLLSDSDEEIIQTGDQMYISQKLGINLTLPSEWQYEEAENKLTIYVQGEEQLLEITKIENERDRDLSKFVDEEDPVDLTINFYEAIRTTKDVNINVYIKAGSNVYKIVFTPIEQTATEKSQFYAVLKTFALNEKVEEETHTRVCGGAGKIECDAGYRCETASDKVLATGVCIKVDADTEELDQEVLDLIEKDIVDQNKIEKEEISVSSAKTEKFQVIDYINEHIKSLISEKEIDGAQIEGYEFSENVVSVILKDSEQKYKIQYIYEAVDEFEVDLKEVAYFVEGDGRDWEKISGEDKQFDTEKEVITSSGEVQAVVYEDMRLYENTHQNYTMQYPRDWYYSSFGASGGSMWHVGFSDKAVELGTEKINVDIFSGKVDTASESDFGGIFKINLPRDDESHFEIYGDEDLKEIVQKMAETIVQN